MSKQALLEALQKQADKELQELAQEAAQRYAELRKESAARLRLVRRDLYNNHHQKLQQALRSERHQLEQELRNALTEHRWAVAQRCRTLASDVLTQLWAAHKEELLPRMIERLPQLQWVEVRVAPSDLQLARSHLAPPRVNGDPELKGGLLATCDDPDMCLDQSLETMLERIWPTLLPKLLQRISDACHPDDN